MTLDRVIESGRWNGLGKTPVDSAQLANPQEVFTWIALANEKREVENQRIKNAYS